MKPELLKQLMEEMIPFNRYLGMQCTRIAEGFCRLEIPFRDELIGDPTRPALHGGVLSSIADTAGGGAVWTTLEDPRARVSTIDLRIDYLRPGRAELLICEATVVRAGNRVAVTDMRVFHPSTESETIATGKGVYNIIVKKTGAVGGIIAELGVKHFFLRQRPTLLSHLEKVSSSSFPSGHAMASASLYLTLAFVAGREKKRAGLLAGSGALALSVSASRVFLGVHWPTDVLGGFALGTAWACLTEAAFDLSAAEQLERASASPA